ncbi:MAG: hypothetical protein AB1486_01825 [Planctomycetota bacterium]
MKLYLWILVFAALVFGVGWASHAITTRAGGGPPPPPEEGPPWWARQVRFSIEPFIGPLEEYARELALSETQLGEIRRLIDEATEVMHERERANRELMSATRDKVRDLLTPEQREEIDRLIDEKIKCYRDARVKAALDWFQRETPRTPQTLATLEKALRQYYEGQASLRGRFHARDGKEVPWPSREECDKRLTELLEQRDAALREAVGEDELEQFRQSERSRSLGRGGHRSWDGERRDGDGRRRPEPGTPGRRSP